MSDACSCPAGRFFAGDFSPERDEELFAMFSMKHKVLQLGISFCAVAALLGETHGAQSAPQADRTTALIMAASDQFQLAYRMNPREAQLRQEQLSSAVAAWRAASRDNANNEMLTTWLRAAIRSSMPGSREGLPPVPTFAVVKHEQRAVTVAKPVVTESKPATSAQPAPKDVRSIAVATSAVGTKTADPTPAANTSDDALSAALLDPFRDDPEDQPSK
jgi:hypothetical protein